MKYSFIIPYYKRPSFRHTLSSFRKWYGGRNDFEIVVIEDYKNLEDEEQHESLLRIMDEFKEFKFVFIVQDLHKCMCPSVSYNLGVKKSSGKFVILTNPEGYHNADVLRGLDDEFQRSVNKYVVCSCLNVKNFTMVDDSAKYDEDGWYQHSVHNKRKLNFCVAMTRHSYNRIQGFDENFRFGYARADADFLFKVIKNKIPIVERDDLMTLHIEHPREYGISEEELNAKINVNREYLEKKWKGVDLWK